MSNYKIRTLFNVYGAEVGFEVRAKNAPADTAADCLFVTKDQVEAEEWAARQDRYDAAQ